MLDLWVGRGIYCFLGLCLLEIREEFRLVLKLFFSSYIYIVYLR